MIKISRLIAILLCLSANALGQGDLQIAVFSSAGPNAETSGFSFNQTFTPVSSYFQVFEGYFPETTIFQGKLTYTGPTAGQSYEMRIGKGGQIYSLISDFGESVPPNHRDKLTNPDTQIHYTPFVDDCCC